MASQTLIFVALPNGLGSGSNLKLSIYLSPRLAQGATLAAFPDFLTWTKSIHDHGLKFQITCGANNVTVSADTKVLRPDIWEAIFTPETYVAPFQFPPFANSLFVSYPTRDALAFLKYAYQYVGVPQHQDIRQGPLEILGSLSFRQGSKSVLTKEMSAMRLELWQEQQNLGQPGIGIAGPQAIPAALAVPPDGIPTTLTRPDATAAHDMATRFALYHHLPKARNRPPLPKPDAGFAKTLDFHAALTALNSYPSLLRALGLVFDVEIPASLCPDSPAAGAYGSLSVSKVTAGFKFHIAPQFNFNATSYWRDKSSFFAAPATSPAGQAAGDFQASDVFKGFLVMSPQFFHLVQLDLDGAMLKALGLADNVANLNDLDNIAAIDQTLPSLRSAGISLMADGRGLQLLQSILNNQSFNTSLTSNTPAPRPYNAQDLVRGYRIDIWSSRTGQWHTLHARTATYRFGAKGTIEFKISEEGFTQLAAASPAQDPTRQPDPFSTKHGLPQPGTDIYIHERVARWNGWSMSVPRPGKPLNRSADPAKALDSEPMNAPVTPFKMTTSFIAAAGSLPELRFGANYRLRARTVDLAGNSVPLKTTAPDGFVAPAGGVLMKYLRFEPVSEPILLLRTAPKAGGSLLRLVIRSYNSSVALDATVTKETDERHVAPPRVAERMVEQHGLLDKNGKLDGDAATYHLITQRDSFQLPTENNQGKVPLEPGATVKVGYLPDPLARGAALRNLPNTPDDTNSRIGGKGLSYATLPDVDPRPGSVTYIDFGAKPWPDQSSFRMVLVEGSSSPHWDPAARVLTVYLQKANLATVPISSYLAAADLEIMGVWSWLQELFEAQELGSMQNAPDVELTLTSDQIAQVIRNTLEGGNEMLTPAKILTLVHAVQQPLGEPTFLQLPVVHQPGAPIYASALRNSFTPITAWRTVDSHVTVLLGGLQINGGSSSKVELNARWLEVTDDPSLPGPTSSVAAQLVETVDLSSLAGGIIYSDPNFTRMLAYYIPQVDVLWFAGPTDVLEGVSNVPFGAVAAPVHRFDDTRHRFIEYTAVATSRFQEYFPSKGLDFTRSGPTLIVDVPSSARPAVPEIAYVVPTFGWENQETTNVKSSVRKSNGLRVYLNRGWYSSGTDELLGVVLWPGGSPAPDYAARESSKELFSQWGVDPIWANGDLAIDPVPAIGNFPNAALTATGLTLAETALTFDVAGHTVVYDAGRELWYCDIEFADLYTYSPFVRLAFARYQSHSIQGVELSNVVLADFAQLAPDRSSVLSVNPADPRNARLFVGGLAPTGPYTPTIQVTVETRARNIASDLDWKPASAAAVTVTEDAPAPAGPNAVLWSGSIVFAKTPPHGQFRVVVREFENILADAASTKLTDPPVIAQRLVYAAILAYDY